MNNFEIRQAVESHLVVRYPATGNIIKDLSRFCASWRPIFLGKDWSVQVLIGAKDIHETDLEVIEKRTSNIHIGHFSDPVVHLDVDVRVWRTE